MGVTALPPTMRSPSKSFSFPLSTGRRGVLGFEEGEELLARSKLFNLRIGDAAAFI